MYDLIFVENRSQGCFGFQDVAVFCTLAVINVLPPQNIQYETVENEINHSGHKADKLPRRQNVIGYIREQKLSLGQSRNTCGKDQLPARLTQRGKFERGRQMCTS